MRPLANDVDEYIANAPEAIRPILVKLRRIFRQASPKLEEAIKWNVPCFTCAGPVGGFAAYKNHVSWGLWKARLLNDPGNLLGRGASVMSGKITNVSEVPPASKIHALIRQVIALNEAGIKPITPDPKLPADFAAVLKKSAEASKLFGALTPARKWQYVNWITQANRPETRSRRIKMSVERISEGKTMK